MPRRLEDEDLHTEKALKMKTSTPRRLEGKELCAKEKFSAEDLRIKKILEEKALRMKVCVPSKSQ